MFRGKTQAMGASSSNRLVNAHSERPWRLLLVVSLSLLVASLTGCLTRQVAPGLPYVQPAQSPGLTESSTVASHLTARMQELEQEMQKVRDLIERQQAAGAGESELRQLQARVAFIEKQLGIEAKPHHSGAAPSTSMTGSPTQSGSDLVARTNKIVGSPATTPQPPLELVNPPQTIEEQSYRDAYAAYKSGDFDQAVKLFEAFLAKHPKSDLAQNAVYWIGEARFSQGRFDEAVLQFDRVIKEFPGSKKELNSLLRQGQAFEKMGDNRSARIIFQKLVTDYPHSAQARIASSRLKSLPANN